MQLFRVLTDSSTKYQQLQMQLKKMSFLLAKKICFSFCGTDTLLKTNIFQSEVREMFLLSSIKKLSRFTISNQRQGSLDTI